MGNNPLLRDRRGTVWFYAGLGVTKAVSTIVVLTVLVVSGLLWGRPFLAGLIDNPTPTPTVTQTETTTPSPPSTPTPTTPSPSDTPTSVSPTPTAPTTPPTTPQTTPPKTTAPPTVKEPVVTTKDEVIPFETQTINDPGLAKGTTEVRQEGQNGIRRITFTDGKQTSSVVLRNPVPRIIAKGTYVAPTQPPKTTQPPPPPPPKYLTLTKTITCSTDASIRVTGSGSGLQSTTITGPRTSSGVNYAEVSGPSGTYTAKVTGTSPRINVSWSGSCSSR